MTFSSDSKPATEDSSQSDNRATVLKASLIKAMVQAIKNLSDNYASGAINQPFVTFSPNWNKIFEHEKITIRCNMLSANTKNIEYKWYKDGVQLNSRLQSIYIASAQLIQSGRYQCQIDNSERSDPVSLQVSKDWVILQGPNSVYEGEKLHLRCHSTAKHSYVVEEITFSKNLKIIQTSDQYSDFYISKVTVNMTGTYNCKMRYTSDQIHSDDTFIFVQEVFSSPKIKMIPYPVVEGDQVTLTCDTSLSPLRLWTELQFAFSKDGRNVQEFGLSNQYGVHSAQLEDSGNYSCQVKTSDYSVTKMSKEICILIQSLLSKPQINAMSYPITEDDNMTLTCDTSLDLLRQTTELQFAFFRNDQIVQNFSISDQYGMQSAQVEDSGNYFCEVKAPSNNVKKRSDVLTIAVQRRLPYKLQNIIRLALSGLILIALVIMLYDNVYRR
ncbi:high affinity immunoglobulin gamma Fc receptor I-like [Mantella aurantiaca]